MTPRPRIQRALPWLSASGSAAFLLVPGIPMWLKASFVFGLVSAVVLMRHRRLHGIDHAALVEQRRDRWQALLDDALAARGAGHVLHLRSGTGRDDAVEGISGQGTWHPFGLCSTPWKASYLFERGQARRLTLLKSLTQIGQLL